MWRNLCIRRTVWKIKMCHINIRTIPDGKTNDNEAHKGKTWEKCKISEVLRSSKLRSLCNRKKSRKWWEKIEIFDLINSGPYTLYITIRWLHRVKRIKKNTKIICWKYYNFSDRCVENTIWFHFHIIYIGIPFKSFIKMVLSVWLMLMHLN